MLADSAEASPIKRSAALHQRVRAFADAHYSSVVSPGIAADSFESLALDIARFQYEFSAGFARSVKKRGGALTQLSDIPLVPTDAFRFTRVAVHPQDLDSALFRTSGTSGHSTGIHAVRDLRTKSRLALLQAKISLFREFDRGIVVALAPKPDAMHSSSLGHMMELFMRHFDGRGLSADPQGVAFSSEEPGRWLIDAGGVDLEGLARAARLAIHRSEPLFVLSTSFALLATLEALDGQGLKTPSRTVIMLTGGFKGRSHQLNERELRAAAAECFHTTEERIVGEYGMTELSSQLFESSEPSVYLSPPWLRVQAVAAHDHSVVKEGDVGLAHFIDLANVDSCISVVTQDLIRLKRGGIELLGRSPNAPLRGCSLPFEGLLSLEAKVKDRQAPSTARLPRTERRSP